MFYKPRYLRPFEVLPPDTCLSHIPVASWSVLAWGLFDARILWTFDQLRDRFGPLVVNDWYWREGGQGNTQRGFRPPESTVGASYSQHRFGRALDCLPARTTAEEIRADIRNHPEREAYQFITGVESGVSWLHVDCRNWDRARHGILFFNA